MNDEGKNMREQTTSIWQKKAAVILGAVFCCFLWGSASPAIKIGYEIFSVAPNDTAGRILFAGIRFTIAGLMVIGYQCVTERQFIFPKKTAWGKVCILYIFQTSIHYILV